MLGERLPGGGQRPALGVRVVLLGKTVVSPNAWAPDLHVDGH